MKSPSSLRAIADDPVVRIQNGWLYPAIQLASAALSLLLWLLLAQVATPSEQLIAVEVYALAPVLALPVTLGIPYLLPNYFRATPKSHRSAGGPWSGALRLATTAAVVTALVGSGIAFVAIASDSKPTIGLGLVFASLFAAWILFAQIARIRESLSVMAVAGLANLVLPLVWLLGTIFEAPTNLTSGASVACALLLLTALIVPNLSLMKRSARAPKYWRKLFQRALPMLPHLALFAVLLQGLRLSSVLLSDGSMQVPSHYLMLTVAIGSVLINSFHSLFTVQIQGAPESEVRAVLPRVSIKYGALGCISALGAIGFISIVGPLAIPGYPLVSPLATVALASVLASLATYYAVSSLALRANLTWALPLASGTAVLLFFWALTHAAGAGIDVQLAIYGATFATMPVTLFLLLALATKRENLRPIVGAVARSASLSFAPILVALVIAMFVD